MARSVASGKSPGWLGTVVYRPVVGLCQISWEPGSLSVKREASPFQTLDNDPVPKPAKTFHLHVDDEAVVEGLANKRKPMLHARL